MTKHAGLLPLSLDYALSAADFQDLVETACVKIAIISRLHETDLGRLNTGRQSKRSFGNKTVYVPYLVS